MAFMSKVFSKYFSFSETKRRSVLDPQSAVRTDSMRMRDSCVCVMRQPALRIPLRELLWEIVQTVRQY